MPFLAVFWGISLQSQILCKQGRSGVTCQVCVSLIESEETVICTSNGHLHLYYKIASWSGALQWLCQLLSLQIQCTWWLTAALQWLWALTLQSSKDQISNSYHGSFIISMAYQSHSLGDCLFVRKWMILLVKPQSQAQLLLNWVLFTEHVWLEVTKLWIIRCLHAVGYHKTFIQELQLNGLLYSLWGRPVVLANKSCYFLLLHW